MLKKRLHLFLFAILTVISGKSHATNMTYGNILKPYTSDGCSSFPDGIPVVNPNLWRKCCIIHDIAYWKGGTAQQRLEADKAIGQCVSKKTTRFLGALVSFGTRFGGYVGLPTTWRWGYGWTLARDYGPLNEDEVRQVNDHELNIPINLDEVLMASSSVISSRDSVSGDHCLDISIKDIYKDLKTSFYFEKKDVSEVTVDRHVEGWVKTYKLKIRGCSSEYKFVFQLLKPGACEVKSPINELLARGRIRLRSVKYPQHCM